jgi:Septin family protein
MTPGAQSSKNIEQRYDTYLEAENKVNRSNIVDNRIHACVYFIQPTGHSLKPLDIEVMRRLHTKVNLIPVIAKADTLTDEEVTLFKQRVCFLESLFDSIEIVDTDSSRSLPISNNTPSRSSKAPATSLTMRRPLLRTKRSCPRFPSPLLVPTPR